jgi:hypothetical protein
MFLLQSHFDPQRRAHDVAAAGLDFSPFPAPVQAKSATISEASRGPVQMPTRDATTGFDAAPAQIPRGFACASGFGIVPNSGRKIPELGESHRRASFPRTRESIFPVAPGPKHQWIPASAGMMSVDGVRGNAGTLSGDRAEPGRGRARTPSGGTATPSQVAP